MTNVTIVTCFYDIRSMENNSGNVRNVDTYFEKGKFVLNLPYNLIIFTEEKYREKFINLRKDNLNKTLIICQPLDETYFWKYNADIIRLQNTYIISNINKIKDTPLYIILTYNKFDFIEKAIHVNPFDSNRFLWLDFGITHVSTSPELIHNWIYNIPEKVKIMEIAAYGHVNTKEYFKKVHHNHAAGLFSGSKSYLLNFVGAFKNMICETINDDWYQLDEAIISMVTGKYPSLFELYYGDYKDIICNYDGYTSGEANIQRIIKSYINSNKLKAYDILLFMKEYFMEKDIMYFFYWYILVNFYSNQERMMDQDILKYFMESSNIDIIDMLYMNIGNLEKYKNTGPLIKILDQSSDNYEDNIETYESVKIGVAIPAIKRDLIVLNRCLQSIENQTRKPNNVVISLSECTQEDVDKSVNINDYDLNIKIVTTPEKQNAATNRNKAASLLPEDTDIICFFDSDDEMSPQKIEYTERAIVVNNDDFVVHNYVQLKTWKQDYMHETFKYKSYKNSLIKNKFSPELSLNPRIRLADRYVCQGHLSLKYDVWKDQKYDESITKLGEDSEYCIRLINSDFTGSYIPLKLSIYHNYRPHISLYNQAKAARWRGDNKLAYDFSLEGLKYLDFVDNKSYNQYNNLFYNELSIVSYYIPDIKMGLFSCDNVILSKRANNNDKNIAIKNVMYYINKLPVIDSFEVSVPFPTNYIGSSPTIIRGPDHLYCMIRGVNYTILENSSYEIRDPHNIIYTRNFIIPMNEDLSWNNEEIMELVINTNAYNGHKFPSKIIGLEDMRLFYFRNKLCFSCTSLEYNHKNIPQICYGEIEISNNKATVTKLIPLQYREFIKYEKNWLPFVVNNNNNDNNNNKEHLLFIYSWDPFIILEFNPDTNILSTKLEKQISDYDLREFRGSAPPIPYKDGYLTTIHYVTKEFPRTYYHRFIYVSKDFETIKISKGFYFKNTDIEFNLSLCHSNYGLLVTSSFRDNSSEINIVDYDTVDEYINYL